MIPVPLTTKDLSDLQDAVELAANHARSAVAEFTKIAAETEQLSCPVLHEMAYNQAESWLKDALKYEALSDKIDTLLTEMM